VWVLDGFLALPSSVACKRNVSRVLYCSLKCDLLRHILGSSASFGDTVNTLHNPVFIAAHSWQSGTFQGSSYNSAAIRSHEPNTELRHVQNSKCKSATFPTNIGGLRQLRTLGILSYIKRQHNCPAICDLRTGPSSTLRPRMLDFIIIMITYEQD
jgi:hypothetical protein